MTGHLLAPDPVRSLDEYLATDTGGLGLHRARQLGPAGTVDEVGRAGLRGRGGGGFPTARKWGGVAAQPGPRYVVCNGAEGEPGTFKDRALLRSNPYQVVEGLLVAAYAIGARDAVIALKRGFGPELDAVTRAVAEMRDAGLAGECAVSVVPGPDEYLFGEEKALLEVIEGKEPLPRQLPPYEHGLFAVGPQLGWQATPETAGGRSHPTVVNNVETLAHAAHVLARGAEWFRSLGTTETPGTFVCTVVGDVARAVVVELPAGTPLRTLVEEHAGGPSPGGSVQAVFPGVANAVLPGTSLDVALSYEGFRAAGSGIGSAGFVVVDDTACLVEVVRTLSRFLYVESCGQCPPCKLGSGEITARLDRLAAGTATDHDVDELGGWLAKVTDGNRCYLAVEEQVLVSSVLRAFPGEVAAHLEGRGCPAPRPFAVPKLVDVRDGRAVVDERQGRKRPDWSYDDG